jgi:hypothetical protein
MPQFFLPGDEEERTSVRKTLTAHSLIARHLFPSFTGIPLICLPSLFEWESAAPILNYGPNAVYMLEWEGKEEEDPVP